MKNCLFKTRRHARHERHDFGVAGMAAWPQIAISLKTTLFMPLMPAMPPFKRLTFFMGGGGIYSLTPERSIMGRLLEAANRYLNHGLAVIPLWPDARKNPHLSSFEEFHSRLPTPFEWRRWAKKWPTANIGLITGYWQNYVCLDFDDELTYDVWWGKWGQKAAGSQVALSPQTWQVKTRRGHHVWFQTCQDPGKSRIFVKDGLEVLLRSKGGYCIVPPSIHHSGTPYKTECNALPLVVESVFDILPGWKEKTIPNAQGDVIAERSLFVTPTKVKIEDLIEIVAEHPNSRGAYLAWCPFHDDKRPQGTPSAWVNIEQQRFGCMRCWERGMWWDVINVYAMLKNISNGEAYKLIRRTA